MGVVTSVPLLAEIDQEMQRRVGISSILPIWRLNGCQKIVINSGIIGPKFTKFLCDVERTSGVLMCPSAFPSCHPLWNRVPRRKAFLPIWRLKLVAMATSLERSRNEYQIEHLQPMSISRENLVKIGLVVSEISLLQAIVKKR